MFLLDIDGVDLAILISTHIRMNSHKNTIPKMIQMKGLYVSSTIRYVAYPFFLHMIEQNNRLFWCVSVRDFEPNIMIKGVHLTNFETNCLIENWFYSNEEWFTFYESKIAKQVYTTVLLFILYSIWVHVERPKYKMSCYLLQKKSSIMFISSCCNNYLID